MTEILTADYMPESTEQLIRRAEQMLEGLPVIGPIESMLVTTRRLPIQMMDGQIRTLAPSCNRIEIKNVTTVTNASIVKCTGSTTETCEAIPVTCSVITPGDYINIVATVNALVAQDGAVIRFEYIENDVSTYTDTTVNLSAGNNTVYAWTPNHQPSIGYTLTLYGARIL